MAGINKVFLIGNLGTEVELRTTHDGTSVANFRMATSETWKDKQTGEKKEKTEWHTIVVWAKQAQTCAEYLHKGRQVHIEGKIQTREWEDDNKNKRYKTEIVADKVTFLKDGSRQSQPQTNNNDDIGF